MKENIQNLDSKSMLDKLKLLNGVKYDINVEKHPFINSDRKDFDPASAKNNLGFIAQDLLKVIPEMVKFDKDLNLYVIQNYEQLFPVIIESIKEQQAIIESQENRINKLENEIKEIRSILLNK